MALVSELPVYRDTMSLTKELYLLVKNFSKMYKYTLGEELTKTPILLIKILFQANSVSNSEKIPFLKKFLENFELLKAFLTLSLELNVCNVTEQKKVLILVDKVGKQVNGWKRKLEDDAKKN